MRDQTYAGAAVLRDQNAFGTMLEQVGFGVAEVSLEGRWLRVNRFLREILGCAADEILRSTVKQITHLDATEADLADCRRLLTGEVPSLSGEKRLLPSDGPAVLVRVTLCVVRDPISGEPSHYLAIVEDLTPPSEAVQKLFLEADCRYRELAERITDVFFTLDSELVYTYWNKAAETITGIPAAGILGKKVGEFSAEGIDLAGGTELYRDVLRTQETRAFPAVFKVGDREFLLEAKAYPRSNGLAVVAQDITRRRGAERAHQELAAIVQSTDEAICTLTLEGKVAIWNLGAERLYGYAATEMVGGEGEVLLPSDRKQEVSVFFQGALKGELIHTHDTQRARKDGSIVNVSLSVFPIRDVQGQVVGVGSISRDITERKLAEESQARRLAFDQLLTGVLTRFATCAAWEIDASVTAALQGLAEFIGVDHAHMIVISPDRTTWTVTHEWCGSNVKPQMANYPAVPFGTIPWSESKILAGEEVRINTLDDYPPEAGAEGLTPDRRAGSQSILLVPNRGPAGAIRGSIGVDSHARPVTWTDEDVSRCRMIGDAVVSVLERKQVDQALRESEARFRAMADSAPIMVWMSGPDKLHTDFNRGWLEFTGRTLSEERGHGWEAGVHPKDLQKRLESYAEAFDNRQASTADYRLRRHDGDYRWIRDTGTPRFSPDGSFAGYIGCCLDITDMRAAELARMELAGRLMHAQESERTRIARELHDDIGQNLALLGMQLQRSMGKAAGGSRKKPLEPGALRDRVKELAHKVSRLSHQLHSSELEFLGLAVAVRSLCREFSEQYHVPVKCSCRDLPRDLDNDVALCFLRVAQEALHNVARHSQAHSAVVEVTAMGGELSLFVRDDGVGFDLEKKPSKASLGLVSMRERMYLVGGEIKIVSQVGGGTRIYAHAPLAKPADTSLEATPRQDSGADRGLSPLRLNQPNDESHDQHDRNEGNHNKAE